MWPDQLFNPGRRAFTISKSQIKKVVSLIGLKNPMWLFSVPPWQLLGAGAESGGVW